MLEPSKYFKADITEDTVLALHGVFDERRIQEFIHLVERKLEKHENELKVKKKIINIMIEVLQNVYHHANETCAIDSYFVLSKEGNSYLINSGNYMPTDNVVRLQKKLDGVNKMTLTQLKSEYISTLDSGTFSVKGGAGLGILDIVRKSGNRVSYEFKEESNSITFFMLKVKISI